MSSANVSFSTVTPFSTVRALKSNLESAASSSVGREEEGVAGLEERKDEDTGKSGLKGEGNEKS